MRADRNLALASLAGVIGNLAGPAGAILTAPILARGLGLTERGDLAGATAPFLLAVAAATFGLPEAMVFLTARAACVDRRVLLRAALVLALAGGIAAGGLALLVSPALRTADARLASWLCLALLPFCLGIGAVRGAAMGVHAWTRVSLEKILTATSRLAAIGCLYLTGNLGVVSGALAIAGSMVIGTAAYAGVFANRRGSAFPRPLHPSAELLGFGLRYWSGSLAGTLLSRLDQVLMVPLTSSAELGLYAVAVSIAEVALILNLALKDIMLATEAGDGNRERVASFARISTLLTSALGVAVLVLSWFAVEPLFGPEFTGSRQIIATLILGVILGNPGSICGAGMSGWGRPGLRSISVAAAAVLNFVLVLLLVPAFGGLGAAYATVAGNALAGNLNIYLCRRYFAMPMKSFYGVRASDLRVLVMGVRTARRRFVS